MEEDYLFSNIRNTLPYELSNIKVVLNLEPRQVLKYCKVEDNNNSNNLISCSDSYMWKQYFRKRFNNEYNNYLESLIEKLKVENVAKFYYDRLQYMVLRDQNPILANIKGIMRDGKDKTNIVLEKYENGFDIEGIETPFRIIDRIDLEPEYDEEEEEDIEIENEDVIEVLITILEKKDFKAFYRLINYKARYFEYQQTLWDAFYTVMTIHTHISELTLPIEFMELLYLKNYQIFSDTIRSVKMFYGTGYYLDSIRNIFEQKNIFDRKVSYFITKRKGALDVIASFILFMTNFDNYNIRARENKGKYTIELWTSKDINLNLNLKKVLIFFDLSLKYLGFSEKSIDSIFVKVQKFLRDSEIKIVNPHSRIPQHVFEGL